MKSDELMNNDDEKLTRIGWIMGKAIYAHVSSIAQHVELWKAIIEGGRTKKDANP